MEIAGKGINMEKEEISKKVSEVKNWFHSIDLGQGIVTPGYKKDTKFEELKMPGLKGKTVLDVGCWDGYYSFECEKRGAGKVLSTDHYVWHEEKFGIKGFLTAREILGSKVDYKDIDVFDISPESVGTWDTVLFLGVYYHLKNPMLALEKLAKVTKHLLVIESHIIITPFHRGIPLSEFYENDELNNDFSNWWGPNLQCLVQTVRASGFEQIDIIKSKIRFGVSIKSTVLELMRIAGLGKLKIPFLAERAIIHAWKTKESRNQFLT